MTIHRFDPTPGTLNCRTCHQPYSICQSKPPIVAVSASKYKKRSLEAKLDELLPTTDGEFYTIRFFELIGEAEGGWSVNDAWTALRDGSRARAIELMRDRWEIFKLNYMPNARVQDISDIGCEDGECNLEVDYTAFADVTISKEQDQ